MDVERQRIKIAFGYYLSHTKKYSRYEPDGWRPSFHSYVVECYCSDIKWFYKCAREYTSNLIKEVGSKEKFLYFDQLIPPIEIKKYSAYFENEPKVFVVDKDPRDLYLATKLFTGSRYIPFQNVDVFINWYKQTRTKSNASGLSNIYHVKLDELANDYENQIKKIEAFIGITAQNHIEPLSLFIPEKTQTNTQLYRRYSNYTEDITKIEKELETFLYSGKEFSIQSLEAYKNPISEILIECDSLQNGGHLKRDRIRSALYSTLFVAQICAFYKRKTLNQKLVGVIKTLFGFFICVFEFLWNLIIS